MTTTRIYTLKDGTGKPFRIYRTCPYCHGIKDSGTAAPCSMCHGSGMIKEDVK